MSSSLHIPAKHGPNIARNVPDSGALEYLIGTVPRGEDVQRPGRRGRLEEAHKKTQTIYHFSAVVAALDEGDNGPESLAYGKDPS